MIAGNQRANLNYLHHSFRVNSGHAGVNRPIGKQIKRNRSSADIISQEVDPESNRKDVTYSDERERERERSIVHEQISPTTAAGDRANSQRAEGLPKVVEGSLPPAKEVCICARETVSHCSANESSRSLFLSLSLSLSESALCRMFTHGHKGARKKEREREARIWKCIHVLHVYVVTHTHTHAHTPSRLVCAPLAATLFAYIRSLYSIYRSAVRLVRLSLKPSSRPKARQRPQSWPVVGVVDG